VGLEAEFALACSSLIESGYFEQKPGSWKQIAALNVINQSELLRFDDFRVDRQQQNRSAASPATVT
jgi:hypothetical protein